MLTVKKAPKIFQLVQIISARFLTVNQHFVDVAHVGPLPRVKPWQLWRFFCPKTPPLSLSLSLQSLSHWPASIFLPSLCRHCKSGDTPSSSSPFMELLPRNLENLKAVETRSDSLVSEFAKDESTEFALPVESSSQVLTLLSSSILPIIFVLDVFCCSD